MCVVVGLEAAATFSYSQKQQKKEKLLCILFHRME